MSEREQVPTGYVDVKLVCECGQKVLYKGQYSRAEFASDKDSGNGYLSVGSDIRYICMDCGKDMTFKVFRIEQETKETVIE